MTTPLFQPRLVNDPFSDVTLYLDLRFGRRALLFDIGDLAPLSSRELLRVSHVFVTHRHMDHFAGFDQLLRLCLYRDMRVDLIGPPGVTDAVEAKLKAYSWNLLGEDSHDFALAAADWGPDGFTHASLFRAREAFRRREVAPPQAMGPVLLDHPEFQVEGLLLDHGIPCLAFAMQEKLRVNVHKARLDELGLPVGPWLTAAKRAVRAGGGPARFTPAPGLTVSTDELVGAGALKTAPGQRIVYATDLAHTEANVEKLVAFARNADQLFIEAVFLEEDRALAAARKHLTAAQAGSIARRANVRVAVPMHFSPRYLDREDALRDEFTRALASG
ncbi:MBL fold metallo-hydrolase [Rhodoligotrophos defluvii]|uniref:MBL fold metallo-hydrolase n=1 Tax=Rhodoligotrophos defluvii TaxID=2561934 RepID=UPI0010C99E4B|nr:MBL fold metallo-hydrolase [Rhodoligotrophos defluvii]